jgi:hypothetical protein
LVDGEPAAAATPCPRTRRLTASRTTNGVLPKAKSPAGSSTEAVPDLMAASTSSCSSEPGLNPCAHFGGQILAAAASAGGNPLNKCFGRSP